MTAPADQPAAEDDGAPAAGRPPAKQHGDPLLAASEGDDHGTQGTRHGADAVQQADESG